MKHARSLILPLVAALAACGAPSSMYSGSTAGMVFHSFFTWRFDSTSGDYGQQIAKMTTELDALTDPYDPASELSKLNRAPTGEWVSVDPTLYDILFTANDLREKTDGYFDPFIGELSTLWKETLFGIDIPKLDDPTVEEVEAAKAKVPAMLERMKNSSLQFDAKSKKVARIGEAKLDLGGIVKGYAVEKAKEMMKEKGAVRYLVNGGQSSLALGQTADYGPFKVSLQYTKNPKEFTYSLQDVECSTSAIYEQRVVVGSEVYSHVLNPKTGLPQTKEHSMAFLVGEKSAQLDALSTSVMIAPLEQTREWAKEFGFEYAVFKDLIYGRAHLVEESSGLAAKRLPYDPQTEE